MLRVISGKLKGRRLKKVKSELVRPTPHKLRKTLFDILQEKVRGSVFIDGFAGTGAVGIEAISWGAKKVYFIENLPEAIKVLRHNIEKCGISHLCEIIELDFNMGIRKLHEEGVKVDIIFIDPPYEFLEKANPLKIIYKKPVLKPGGIIVLQHLCETKFDPKFFTPYRQVKQGISCLTFYRGGKNES